MAPRTHPTDVRRRPYIQVRFYGQLAIDIDKAADAEGKARSTLVAELIAKAWAIEAETGERIEPTRSFVRQAPRVVDASDDEIAPTAQATSEAVVRHRAHVFAPPGHR